MSLCGQVGLLLACCLLSCILPVCLGQAPCAKELALHLASHGVPLGGDLRELERAIEDALQHSTSCLEEGGLHGAQLAAAIGVPSAVAGVLLLVLLAFFVVGHARRGLQRRATGLQKEAEEADDEADMDLEQGPSVWRMLSECIGRSAEATVARTRQSIDIAPGVGLDTTLLLSDVQNSTALWEMFPTQIMDESMRLHDDCFRKFLGKHKGYESATEGDAMILAFPTPASALRFAVDVQLALAEVSWPTQLLISPDARAVHVLLEPETSEEKVVKAVSKHSKVWTPSMAALMETSASVGAVPLGSSMHNHKTSAGGNSGNISVASNALKSALYSVDSASIAAASGSVSGRHQTMRRQYSGGSIDSEGGTSDIDAAEPKQSAATWTTELAALAPIDCTSWGRQLGLALPRVREAVAQKAGPGHSQVIFKGLRVRMGMHCGIENAEDVVFEPVSGRTVYGGAALEVARAVCDAAPGGGILLSADAFVRLPHLVLASTNQVDKLVNGGATMAGLQALEKSGPDKRGRSFDLRGKSFLDAYRPRPSMSLSRGATPPTTQASVSSVVQEPINALVVYAGDHKMKKLEGHSGPWGTAPLSLYCAVPSTMPGRLPWLPALRNNTPVALGTLAAPVGTVTIAFCNVVNAAVLLTELPQPARQAISLFQSTCVGLLTKHDGYAVEVVDGLLLAAFPHPAQAVLWALACNTSLAELEWPEELLAHPMCSGEEYSMGAPWEVPADVMAASKPAGARSFLSGGVGGSTNMLLLSGASRPGSSLTGGPLAVHPSTKSAPHPVQPLPMSPTGAMAAAQASLAARVSNSVMGASSHPGFAPAMPPAKPRSDPAPGPHASMGAAALAYLEAGHETQQGGAGATEAQPSGSGGREKQQQQGPRPSSQAATRPASQVSLVHAGASEQAASSDAPSRWHSSVLEGAPSAQGPAGQANNNNSSLLNQRNSATLSSDASLLRLPLEEVAEGVESVTFLTAAVGQEHHRLGGAEVHARSGAGRSGAAHEEGPRLELAGGAAPRHVKGLRLRTGIDVGKVAATVVPLTGRIHYRGKVMNRAARIAARCQTSQVLATSLVWRYAQQHETVRSMGVCGDELGEAEMKGVPGLVELVHCFQSKAEAESRALAAADRIADALVTAHGMGMGAHDSGPDSRVTPPADINVVARALRTKQATMESSRNHEGGSMNEGSGRSGTSRIEAAAAAAIRAVDAAARVSGSSNHSATAADGPGSANSGHRLFRAASGLFNNPGSAGYVPPGLTRMASGVQLNSPLASPSASASLSVGGLLPQGGSSSSNAYQAAGGGSFGLVQAGIAQLPPSKLSSGSLRAQSPKHILLLPMIAKGGNIMEGSGLSGSAAPSPRDSGKLHSGSSQAPSRTTGDRLAVDSAEQAGADLHAAGNRLTGGSAGAGGEAPGGPSEGSEGNSTIEAPLEYLLGTKVTDLSDVTLHKSLAGYPVSSRSGASYQSGRKAVTAEVVVVEDASTSTGTGTGAGSNSMQQEQEQLQQGQGQRQGQGQDHDAARQQGQGSGQQHFIETMGTGYDLYAAMHSTQDLAEHLLQRTTPGSSAIRDGSGNTTQGQLMIMESLHSMQGISVMSTITVQQQLRVQGPGGGLQRPTSPAPEQPYPPGMAELSMSQMGDLQVTNPLFMPQRQPQEGASYPHGPESEAAALSSFDDSGTGAPPTAPVTPALFKAPQASEPFLQPPPQGAQATGGAAVLRQQRGAHPGPATMQQQQQQQAAAHHAHAQPAGAVPTPVALAYASASAAGLRPTISLPAGTVPPLMSPQAAAVTHAPPLSARGPGLPPQHPHGPAPYSRTQPNLPTVSSSDNLAGGQLARKGSQETVMRTKGGVYVRDASGFLRFRLQTQDSGGLGSSGLSDVAAPAGMTMSSGQLAWGPIGSGGSFSSGAMQAYSQMYASQGGMGRAHGMLRPVGPPHLIRNQSAAASTVAGATPEAAAHSGSGAPAAAFAPAGVPGRTVRDAAAFAPAGAETAISGVDAWPGKQMLGPSGFLLRKHNSTGTLGLVEEEGEHAGAEPAAGANPTPGMAAAAERLAQGLYGTVDAASSGADGGGAQPASLHSHAADASGVSSQGMGGLFGNSFAELPVADAFYEAINAAPQHQQQQHGRPRHGKQASGGVPPDTYYGNLQAMVAFAAPELQGSSSGGGAGAASGAAGAPGVVSPPSSSSIHQRSGSQLLRVLGEKAVLRQQQSAQKISLDSGSGPALTPATAAVADSGSNSAAPPQAAPAAGEEEEDRLSRQFTTFDI